jgi:hypothetical protein
VATATTGLEELIAALSHSDDRAMKSHLIRLMQHIIKWKVQPERRSRDLSSNLALRLEKAFGTSRQAWLNMQQNYDLWHAEQEVDLSAVQVFVTTKEA